MFPAAFEACGASPALARPPQVAQVRFRRRDVERDVAHRGLGSVAGSPILIIGTRRGSLRTLRVWINFRTRSGDLGWRSSSPFTSRAGNLVARQWLFVP